MAARRAVLGSVLFGVLLVAATATAYRPALRGGFVWDDDRYLLNNPPIQEPGGLERIWLEPASCPQYYPLTFTSLWLEWRLWGEHAAGYHITNLLLHVAAALCLASVLRALGVPGAWFAAALFALHPVQVESVAWITERKNVLSGVLTLLSLRAYLTWSPPERGERGRPALYAAALGLFVGALLAKTVAGVLPGVVLVLVWWKRGRIERRDVMPLLPFIALALALGTATAWIEKHHVGAWGPPWDLSWVERVLVAGRAVWFYAGKLLWPAHLSFVYPRPLPDPTNALDVLLPVAAVIVVTVLWLARRRIGRGPLAAVLIFVGALFPALSFANVYPMRYSFVADHFQYLASAALLALAAAALARAIGDRRVPLAIVALVLCAALGARTTSHARAFASVEALWRATLAANPAAAIAHANLASYLHETGRLDEAEREYQAALVLEPDNLPARIRLAQLLEQRGRDDAAEAELVAAAEVPNRYPPGSPGFRQQADPWFHLGVFRGNRGRAAEAEQAYRQALTVEPFHPGALTALGSLLARLGRLEEAEASLRGAVEVAPGSSAAWSALAGVRGARGDLAEAISLWERALALAPDDPVALSNLGAAWIARGQPDRALAPLRRAVALDPSFQPARKNLDEAERRAKPNTRP